MMYLEILFQNDRKHKSKVRFLTEFAGNCNKLSWRANLCQCLTTASVESIIVPSMSKRRPEKVTSCGGVENIFEAGEII